MSGTWVERVTAIGENLLTLEINTVVTDDLSAQKMPEIPLALHTLVQVYNDYLANAGFQVTDGLMALAVRRVNGENDDGTNAGAKALLLQLQSWHPEGRLWTASEKKAALPGIPDDQVDATGPTSELTNGAETFEALQWAAWATIQTRRASNAIQGVALVQLGGVEPSILSRIYANCRQLKEAALRLEQQNHGVNAAVQQPATTSGWRIGFRAEPAKPSMAGLKDRLNKLAAGTLRDPAAKTTQRLFGATIEETARALFSHPRPVFDTDPDVNMLIRKAWDLGVERVCLQTVLQVDGDLTEIIAESDGVDRTYLTELHRQAVKDAVSQWRSFWDVVLQLAGDIGKIFTRA